MYECTKIRDQFELTLCVVSVYGYSKAMPSPPTKLTLAPTESNWPCKVHLNTCHFDKPGSYCPVRRLQIFFQINPAFQIILLNHQY
mmetsp:Transcript_11934/g.23786  ORF Transcript_11934/g.23786 Transcript_11934/m.23786 type:complete len:86 (+) Transcript_11934:161-418(+)